MPDFRRITLADKEWIDPLLRMGNLRGSEYTFTNNFIYRTIYHIEVARMNDYYLVRSHREGGAYSYLYPAGSGRPQAGPSTRSSRTRRSSGSPST